jgi:hypothetical protein
MEDDWKTAPSSLEDLAFKGSHTYERDSLTAPIPKTIGDVIKQSMDRNQSTMVNHPPHYTQHPSGVECIQITEHMSFCLGNAVKYIWRSGLKSKDPIMDLEKAAFYINREIQRIKALN